MREKLHEKSHHKDQSREQQYSKWIDQAFGSRENKIIKRDYLQGILTPAQLEVMNIDTYSDGSPREVDPASDQRPLVINLTGNWGQGTQVEAEAKAFAIAMGDIPFGMVNPSLPEHGASGKLEKGWNSDEDFDKSADAIGLYLTELHEKSPKRKIILNAWSMGGVTALLLVKKFPGLIDGLVLMDTPAFPMDFNEVAKNFVLYAGAKGIQKEDPFSGIKTKFKGLSVFIERLRDQGKELNGMNLRKVVLASGKSLAKQDMTQTLQTFSRADDNKNRDIQILLLRGGNDSVISHRTQTDEIARIVRFDVGGHLEVIEVPGAGHQLPDEQPREVGRLLRDWMEFHTLIPGADSQPAKDDPLAVTYDKKTGEWNPSDSSSRE